MGVFFSNKNVTFNGELEKESITGCEDRIENLSGRITVCHHSASLVMPNGDPWDGFFYLTLTLMIDAYILSLQLI